MTSSLTETDISNMALDWLAQKSIGDIDEGGSVANWYKRNFAQTRDALLRSHKWNFAVTRAEITERSDTPDFGWDYWYNLPGDCLRLFRLRQGGEWEGNLIEYELEAHPTESRQVIMCDLSDSIKIRYIRRIEETGMFDPLFVEALSLSLAAKHTHKLTQKNTLLATLRDTLRDARETAIRVDGMEAPMEGTQRNEVIDAR